MLKIYHQNSKADYYIIGFEYQGSIWLATVDKLMPRYTKIMYTSHKAGHKKKLQMCLTSKVKKQLVRNAFLVGDVSILNNGNNKGIELEKLIYGIYGQIYKGHNNTPFYKDGDITINNKKVQIKYENAQICLESTLKNLITN